MSNLLFPKWTESDKLSKPSVSGAMRRSKSTNDLNSGGTLNANAPDFVPPSNGPLPVDIIKTIPLDIHHGASLGVSPSLSREMSLNTADFAKMAISPINPSVELPAATTMDNLLLGTFFAPSTPNGLTVKPQEVGHGAEAPPPGLLSRGHHDEHKKHATLSMISGTAPKYIPPPKNLEFADFTQFQVTSPPQQMLPGAAGMAFPGPMAAGGVPMQSMAANPMLIPNAVPLQPINAAVPIPNLVPIPIPVQNVGPFGRNKYDRGGDDGRSSERKRSRGGGTRRGFTRRLFGRHGSISQCVSEGVLVEMMAEQHGSRFLQNTYQGLSASDRVNAVSLLLENTERYLFLVNHVFANWVIQSMFELAEHAERCRMVRALNGQILNISKSKFGCRLIQRIVSGPNGANDVLLKQLVLRELAGKTMDCLANTAGHHVVERILSDCTPALCQPILEEILPNLKVLAVDPFGAHIIELILRKFPMKNPSVQHLMASIGDDVVEMARHKFANYIIQDIIQHAPEALHDRMFKALFADIADLATNKFSSNVVEKAIYLATNKRRRKLVRSLVNDKLRGSAYWPDNVQCTSQLRVIVNSISIKQFVHMLT